jgi:hypothetical protein
LQTEENELKKSLSTEHREMERLLNKRSIIVEKKEDCVRSIRGLGSLPSHSLEKYDAIPVLPAVISISTYLLYHRSVFAVLRA